MDGVRYTFHKQKRRNHARTAVPQSESTASSPSTQVSSSKSTTHAWTPNQVYALLKAERTSGPTPPERAFLYTLSITAGAFHPPSCCAASRGKPFVRNSLAPPIRWDRFRPSGTPSSEADVPNAASERPKRARANPTKSRGSTPRQTNVAHGRGRQRATFPTTAIPTTGALDRHHPTRARKQGGQAAPRQTGHPSDGGP